MNPTASETPDLSDYPSVTAYISYVGGVRRNKAASPAPRISPHANRRVSGTTGARSVLWLTGVLIVSVAPACLAAEAAVPAQTAVAPATDPPATDSATPPAKRWPPAVQMLSPSHPLDHKSSLSIGLVEKWKDKNVKPSMGARGEVRFIYGATQDTVVCAPLRLCDIALEPGEIVRNVNIGDPVMWSCPPAISGTGAAEITHLMCKPADAGLETSLTIQTTRRSYWINLISTRKNYMPMISWTYPEDQASQWAAYKQHGGHGGSQIPEGGYIQYSLSGDNPPWRPIEAYSDGKKTYIWFPPAMAYGKAPVLERAQ